MKRHAAGDARVIPIVLRPVDWERSDLGGLQALPTNAKPVTTWKNRDQAFRDVARGIRAAVARLEKTADANTVGEKREASRSAYFLNHTSFLRADRQAEFRARTVSLSTITTFVSSLTLRIRNAR